MRFCLISEETSWPGADLRKYKEYLLLAMLNNLIAKKKKKL